MSLSPKKASIAVLLVALLGARTAAAEATCTSSRPMVELVLEVEPPDREIGQNLASHLEAELRPRNIDLCAGSTPSSTPVARIRLHVERPTGGPVVATIEIADAVTDKRVERRIDLTRMPPDARALAVASSTDELLRASWAELKIKDAPPPSRPPPPAVVEAVNASLESAASTSSVAPIELGVAAHLSSFPSNREAVGGDVLVRGWFHPRIAGLAGVGGSFGFTRPGRSGPVRADDLAATLGGAFALLGHETLAVDIEAGITLMRVTFTSDVTSAIDWAAIARIGARGSVRAGPVRIALSAAGLLPIRGSEGTDRGEAVTSIAGPGVEVGLGLLVPLAIAAP
jgi:hypothetical protein